jgi:hypothetical protein
MTKALGLALGGLLILCFTGPGEDGVEIGWPAGARPAAKATVETAGATSAFGVIVATGGILATGDLNPGRLYRIDPTQPAGAVTTIATNLRGGPLGIAFDGSRIRQHRSLRFARNSLQFPHRSLQRRHQLLDHGEYGPRPARPILKGQKT